MAETPSKSSIPSTNEGETLAKAVAEGFPHGRAPLKIVTGVQTTSNLSFDLKPGAIESHANARVIFVCG